MLNCPDRSVDWTHGGQFLHLLWTIEEFLNNLLISGIKFDLIFFESHVALWQDPAMLCFRALLISHLKNNTTITIHLDEVVVKHGCYKKLTDCREEREFTPCTICVHL
jgi:hypothetical protein